MLPSDSDSAEVAAVHVLHAALESVPVSALLQPVLYYRQFKQLPGSSATSSLLAREQRFDLSCLIAPPKRSRASEAALKRVNVLNGVWPEEALVQYTTLDPAQRGAIKVRVFTNDSSLTTTQ